MASPFHGGRSPFIRNQPWLHYVVKNTPAFMIETPGGSGGMRSQVLLPVGTHFVLDFLSQGVGYAKIASGVFDAVMMPYRTPLPPRPSSEHKEAVQFRVLVAGHGLQTWTMASAYLMNWAALLRQQYETFAHAVRSELPIYVYLGDEPHTMATWAGDTFYTPNVRIEDWIPRDDDTFGRGTVRPPLPILEQTEPPVTLPPASEDPPTTAAPIPPQALAADPSVPYRPVPSSQVPPASPPPTTSVAPAKEDLLSKYLRNRQ
jgi:hypothetical protein